MTVLLSRIAETVFWMGRYVERSEDLARAIAAHARLGARLSETGQADWARLTELGAEELPSDLADRNTPQQALAYLVVDPANPGSVISAVRRACDNLRQCRTVVPREAWTTFSQLLERLLEGRHDASPEPVSHLLDDVVASCQRVTGQISATMSRDAAHAFWRLGRYLERADMTLRITHLALTPVDGDAALAYRDARWTELLHALGAQQMYGRRHCSRVSGRLSLTFVLEDNDFPRSYRHCLEQIARELCHLPGAEELTGRASLLARHDVVDDAGSPHDLVEAMLDELATLGQALEVTYFHGPADLTPLGPDVGPYGAATGDSA